VEASWKIEGGRLTLDVWIPVGSSAEVHILTASPGEVLEGQRPAGEAPGVKFLRIERGRAVFAVASGRYRFACTAVEPAGNSAP
jgi:alpha-L-rhamnosidase